MNFMHNFLLLFKICFHTQRGFSHTFIEKKIYLSLEKRKTHAISFSSYLFFNASYYYSVMDLYFLYKRLVLTSFDTLEKSKKLLLYPRGLHLYYG